MKETEIEKIIRIHEAQRRNFRNAQLKRRVACGKSFEEMLDELSALHGLNAAERERGSAEKFYSPALFV